MVEISICLEDGLKVTKLLRTVIINWEEVEPGNYARKVKVNLTFQLELFPLGEGADIADFMEVLEEETDQPGEDPGDGDHALCHGDHALCHGDIGVGRDCDARQNKVFNGQV